jgi:hypothetical protein
VTFLANCAALGGRGGGAGTSGNGGNMGSGTSSQNSVPGGPGGNFNLVTAPSAINVNPATGGAIPAATRFTNQPIDLHGGINQNFPGMPPGPTTALPFPAMTAAPFISPLPTTVFPGFTGGAAMICYMIPVVNVPTSFTTNINLGGITTPGMGGFTIPAIPAITPNPVGPGTATSGAMGGTTSGPISSTMASSANEATVPGSVGGVTSSASITTMSPATMTCSPTGNDCPNQNSKVILIYYYEI